MRKTRQKESIAQALCAAEQPLSVPEVLALAQAQWPKLGIATVYREIHRLCETGALQVVSIPGDPPRYETPRQHHHHFKCTACAHVYDIQGCVRDVTSLLPEGFVHLGHELTLYGRCRACA